MPYLLVRHSVAEADYEAWKQAFDGGAGVRRDNGSRGGTVFRGTADPADVVVLLEWDGADRAAAFAGSNELWQALALDRTPGAAAVSVLEEADDPPI